MASRWRSSLGFLISGLLMGLPRYAFIRAGRALRVQGPSGMELSSSWWLLTLFYLIADVLILTLLSYLWTRRMTGHAHSNDLFRTNFVEILQVVIMWHFTLLMFDYPVSAKLESVGLGGLEVVAASAFAVTVVPLLMRLRKFLGRHGPYDESSPSSAQPPGEHLPAQRRVNTTYCEISAGRTIEPTSNATLDTGR